LLLGNLIRAEKRPECLRDFVDGHWACILD
jgi:hypothetical protein